MRTFKTFSQVSDLFPDGLMLLDEQAKVLHANHKLKTDLSLNVEASGYHSFFELAPYDNMLSWRRRWKKLQSVDFHEEETDLLTTRGHTFPARLKYRLIETDKGNLCLITVQNTLQKERFRNLYELSATCSRLGAWEWDLQRDQVYLSRELQTMTGVKTSENPCTVDTFWDIASDHLLPAATAGLKDQFRKLRDADHELRTEIVLSGTPEGKKRFELTGRAVRFDDTPVRIYGTLQDHAAISSRSEEMYMAQFTVENAREMIFWIRADGSIFYVNQAAVDKLGYSRQELTNLHVADIDVDFTPDYWPVHWAELREKKQMEIEATHRTKAGKKFPVEGNLNFIEFEGEYFNCALMRDVSLKKKRDRRIKLAEFTIDAFPDMLLWVKNDGTILHSNPACTQTLGYTKEELHQQRVWDLLPRLDQDSWKAFCLQLRQKKSRTLQNDMLSKSAGRIPTEIAASTLRFEGDELISLHIKDMRQRLKKSRQLEFAMNTLERSNDLIFWVRQDGTFSYCNEAVQDVLGYTREACLEMSIFDLDETYTQQRLDDSWKKLRAGETIRGEALLQHKDGSKIPVDVATYYIQFGGEEYRCSIVRDMSEPRKREQRLEAALEKIQQLRHQLEQEKSYLMEEVNVNYNFNNIISKSPKYHPVLKQVRRVADTDATVLILGETGTGKELLARAIHNLSSRSDRAMVKVNCAALPENLIESELFGHEKGAFTGAYQKKPGRFEMADKGTIFLDEVGELPLELQSKLLRVLQEGEFERLGSTETLKTDVRVITATNRDLETLVSQGKFREDLFYRLNVFPIYNIPLRERREDIPLLAMHFVKRFSEKMGYKDLNTSQAMMKRLQRYDFPGNIRELENIIERAVILSDGKTLKLDIEGPRNGKTRRRKKGADHFLSFEEMQKQHILEALERTNWKVTGKMSASELLNMNGKTLASKMRKLGLKREDYVQM